MEQGVQDISTKRVMPAGVWVLGFVSLFMDVASEMIHSLLPLFMVTTLGATAIAVGWIDGLAKSTALIIKVFSGVLSDWFGKRKWLAVLGYGLGALSKPLFAMAPSVWMVLYARLLDRVGKGIRGAPRDALVADVTPEEMRGAAYGLRQSLDTIGAFGGPLLAVLLIWLWNGDYRAVFWVAVIPATISVLLLILFLKEPSQPIVHKRVNPLKKESIRMLPAAFWSMVVVGAVFSLARFSDAFLLLRAEEGGLELFWIPMMLVVMNLAYSLTSYPAGKLSDRIGHTGLLIWGLVLLIVSDLVLASGNHWLAVGAGAALLGVHLGMTQGVMASMISRTAPKELRGTAFGLFNLATGISLLIASVTAGLIWEYLGSSMTFYAGALFSAIALFLFLLISRQGKNKDPLSAYRN